MNRTIHFLSTSRTALILLLATLLTATAAQTTWATETETSTINGTENLTRGQSPCAHAILAVLATSDEPERYAALIRALNDNIDYTRRHAMHRKQKSDEPQPDGGDKE